MIDSNICRLLYYSQQLAEEQATMHLLLSRELLRRIYSLTIILLRIPSPDDPIGCIHLSII